MSLNLDWVRGRLPGRRIEWLDRTGSTMLEAARLAAEGCPSGTVVGAEEQTAGQGRLGRSWHSEPGAGLYFSVVLRLAIPPAQLPVLTLALGLAAADAVRLLGGTPCDLRWPNDVLIGDKKVAGILVQLHGSAVVAGIGLNVNQESFPPELADIATSLRLESGCEHQREALLVYLLSSIDSFVKVLVTSGVEPILQAFENRSTYVRNRHVIVDSGISGITDGLTPAGFLVLKRDDGTRETILAGGVRPCS